MAKGIFGSFMKILKNAESEQKQQKPKPLMQKDNSLDTKISDLGKQATAFKSNKDWDSAITCLKEINKLSSQSTTSYPITHHLRLPLFLQQGGYYDEAMKEFQKILDDVPNQINREYSHQPKSTQKMLSYSQFSQIYKSMHTANKREKLLDKAEEYKKISDDYHIKHQELLKADN